MDVLFQFQWSVDTAGYRISEGRLANLDVTEPLLIANAPPGDAHEVRIYDPLQNHTGLYLAFASLKANEESIVNFANRFGFLGDAVWASVEESPITLWGESLAEWRAQISKMKHAVALWRMAKEHDPQLNTLKVERREVQDSDPTYTIVFEGYRTRAKPDAVARFKTGDSIRPALYAVQQIVNSELHKHTSARMLWGADWKRLEFHVTPTTLIGALWLQFASAVSRDPKYNRCESCGMFFEVSRQVGARTDKLFCGNPCRQKAYRERQKAALMKQKQKRRPRKK